ncbi:hypothetical protein PIIN_10171 [Serendipita indica DSM 11827]|uniref:C2H2-type domain-containing protein n=1 Tax=Serendipita indica (strain DSM 11827) TaxID=1109443 RepID=G4TXY5_SERID|nr:hypothetical protein PIIN_10171 [Serendipita indica DSM 11827]
MSTLGTRKTFPQVSQTVRALHNGNGLPSLEPILLDLSAATAGSAMGHCLAPNSRPQADCPLLWDTNMYYDPNMPLQNPETLVFEQTFADIPFRAQDAEPMLRSNQVLPMNLCFFSSPYTQYVPGTSDGNLISTEILPPFQVSTALSRQAAESTVHYYHTDFVQNTPLFEPLLTSSPRLHADKPLPNNASEQLQYLRFLNRSEQTRKYHCRFGDCGKQIKRRDRAIAHVRGDHFKYLPFACSGGCQKVGCNLRFKSLMSLKDHRKHRTVVCKACGRQLRSQNLKRHQKSCHVKTNN